MKSHFHGAWGVTLALLHPLHEPLFIYLIITCFHILVDFFHTGSMQMVIFACHTWQRCNLLKCAFCNPSPLFLMPPVSTASLKSGERQRGDIYLNKKRKGEPMPNFYLNFEVRMETNQ